MQTETGPLPVDPPMVEGPSPVIPAPTPYKGERTPAKPDEPKRNTPTAPNKA